MKTLIICILLSCCSFSWGQKPTTTVVKIKTSTQCGDCKERIETKLNYTKGIKYAEVDLENKTVEIKFNSQKISLQKIKETIASIGYNADEINAKQEDILKLPKCCQPNGMENH